MQARNKRAISAEQAELLRQIPSVDELLLQPRLAGLSKRVDRSLVVEVARAVLADLRARIAGDSNWTALSVTAETVEECIASAVERLLSRSLQPVINATERILHTNLGRAPLRSGHHQPHAPGGLRKRHQRKDARAAPRAPLEFQGHGFYR